MEESLIEVVINKSSLARKIIVMLKVTECIGSFLVKPGIKVHAGQVLVFELDCVRVATSGDANKTIVGFAMHDVDTRDGFARMVCIGRRISN